MANMILHAFHIYNSWNYQITGSYRGNKFKLVQHHCHYGLRKYNYNRVIPIWNSLPNFVVSAGAINTL